MLSIFSIILLVYFFINLENCAKKCITLSETIEKFYGKSSTSAFLTKGLELDKEKDLKLI